MPASRAARTKPRPSPTRRGRKWRLMPRRPKRGRRSPIRPANSAANFARDNSSYSRSGFSFVAPLRGPIPDQQNDGSAHLHPSEPAEPSEKGQAHQSGQPQKAGSNDDIAAITG